MLQPATRLSHLSYELRGALPRLADELEQQGRDIIRLHLGDPAAHGITPPPAVTDTVRHHLTASCGYGPTQGLPEARSAIASYYRDRGLTALEPHDIHIGNGVSELVLLALQALLNPGDEVLLPSPGYPLWAAAVQLAGGTPVFYRCDEHSGWLPDVADLRSKISDRAVALVANSPHNPTGAVWPIEILRTFTDIARHRRLVLLSDEIYAHIVYDAQHTVLARLAPDLPCLTFGGLSKTHCVPGFRVGWMALTGPHSATHAYAEAVTLLASLRLCPSTPAQHGIGPALRHIHRTETHLTGPGGILRQRHEDAWEALHGIPGMSCARPQGAFYLFPRVPPGHRDSTFARTLLREHGVLVAPGSDFRWDAADHVRISTLAAPQQLKEAVHRIAHHAATVS
ncbi:aminotransferase class I/II-fold pyridoxal phosphate-dependent enzyme [Streptomyces atriruber]|uniref:aminotransferase class I/II-fold pyridoxal phosphate-dependent enzyme n=1 Tax=Streptomyces atriruber TaxID=545121 RepID=UPI0006E39B5A|nr:aminotransferase class I/II-fold pyridoxal phosphate-dependent enzyme [Streptomyces atriruber]